RRAVRELLAAGRRRTHDLWVAAEGDEIAGLAEILGLAADRRVAVHRVSPGRLAAEARTAVPQGVIAHAEPLAEEALDQLTRRRPGQPAPFLLVLDGVTDPQNVGALLRTAACAGVTGVVLPRHRAAHVTPSVAKAAAGAVEHLPFAVVAGIPAALAELAGAGVWALGLDPSADRPLYDVEVLAEPVALVLGAEGAGLHRLVRARCDVVAAIPQVGPLSSLNVAAAGAVACFEVARARR
ncbi:MAG: 23S rRNA (guanosine(2251)-2'-O)-methyltransferase RlmB, partial [Acidimicrobiales bacterium]